MSKTALLFGKKAAFSPTSLFVGDTGGWWDASDHTTTWQDTAGTTPATVNNDPVARIDDKSGNGNNLLQATPADRPLLKTAGGLWWLEFDGISQYLNATFTNNQPVTRYFAVNLLVDNTGQYLFDGGSVVTGAIYENNPVPELNTYAGNPGPTSSGFTVAADHVLINVINGASSSIAVDNLTPQTGDEGATNPGGLTIAIPGNFNTALATNLRFYAGMTIGRTLLAGEAANSLTFFGAKAGLVL